MSEHALANVGINPNSTSDRLFVNIGGSAASFDLNMVNAAGQQVMTDRISNNTVLDLSGFENGVYMLKIRNVATGAVSRERVVKQ
ncbi:MAG: T9SS type A sorting domain-containing protein [Flavobacteriales bacterium]